MSNVAGNVSTPRSKFQQRASNVDARNKMYGEQPMPENKIRHEFKVVIEGFELPSEFVARINKAVQRVVLDLEEMASADGPTSAATMWYLHR
jgi:hypothetical protein